MKKILVIAAGIILATAVAVNAQDTTTKKKEMTPEQKSLRKEMTTKYDTNGDKKLDKDELAKVSAEDKEKMEKAGIWPKEHKKKKDSQ